MKIVHIITGGKGRGGAEGVLLRLVNATSNKIDHTVYTLLDMPEYVDDFKRAGVAIHSLNIRNPKSFALNLFYLKKQWKNCPPDVIQSWMAHPNILSGLLGKGLDIPIVWNIRQSLILKEELGLKNYTLMKASAWISKKTPYKIINCSLKSIERHKEGGFYDKFIYIPNGVEVEPNAKDLGSPRKDKEFTVGHIGRYDPAKNHKLFIESFSRFNKRHSDSKTLMAGTGVSYDNAAFQNRFGSLINHSFKLLGQMDGIAELPEVYKKMDCLVLSSITEGFPNVLIEAMSFGLPCISTDVGDAAEIIGDTGWIVPSEDQDALEKALEVAYRECIDFPEKWADRSARAYNRIVENYSIEKMCERYIDVWNDAINQTPGNRSH